MSVATNQSQANEIVARQIAEDLDNGAVPDGKVIYDGQIMTREAALAKHDEAIVTARKSAFFDVQDAIEDYLTQGPARLRLRSNVLWGLGYRVIGALRDVIYRMGDHSKELGINRFNEFLAGLSEAESGAQYAEQLGYAFYGSGIQKARALFTLYNQWRELAIKEFGISGMRRRDNDLPSLFDLAQQEPQYDSSEAEKMIVATRMMLEGEPADVIEEAVALCIAKAHEDHKMRVLNNEQMAPALIKLIGELHDVEDFQFYDLPIDVQGTLITATLNSTKKIPQQLAKMRSVSTLDMVTAIPQLRRLQAKLENVLTDPRFE